MTSKKVTDCVFLLTESRTSDVEMPDNVMTSTPERQQISISEKVVDLTLEQHIVEINHGKDISYFEGTQVLSEKETNMSKSERKLIWKDMKPGTVIFQNLHDEDENKKLNQGDNQLSHTGIRKPSPYLSL